MISAVTVSNPPCMRALFGNKFNNSCDRQTIPIPTPFRLSSTSLLWSTLGEILVHSRCEFSLRNSPHPMQANRASSTLSNLFHFSHLTLSKEKCTELNQILPTTTHQDRVQGRQTSTQTEARKPSAFLPDSEARTTNTALLCELLMASEAEGNDGA